MTAAGMYQLFMRNVYNHDDVQLFSRNTLNRSLRISQAMGRSDRNGERNFRRIL